MSETVLAVTGMSCGGCVASVTNVLSALPGVKSANVTLDPPQAVVVHDDAQAPVAALVQAVVDAGFGASTAS